MNAALGAALVAAVAAALLVGGPHRAPRPDHRPTVRAVALVPVGLAIVTAMVLFGGTREAILGATALGVAAGGRWLLLRQRGAARAEGAAARATEFCDAVAAELSAGAPPHDALAAAAGDLPEFVPVATAGRLGGDVPSALRLLGRQPGLADLRLVAAAWHVSHRSGAGLAEALRRVGDTLRARRRVARLVAAELASARATARVMAALPVVFALAGSGLGADPLGFLLGGTPGALCLAGGLALTWAGLAWLQRIADSISTGAGSS